jgi:CheY-like chemotaxis protein
MLGLIRPDEGSINVMGMGIEHSWDIRRRLGYMPEHSSLPMGMTARDLVVHMGELRGLPRRVAVLRASEVLFQVGLEEERSRLIRTFSVGMRQRTNLAQAIVHSPAMVILDEPTNGLDPAGREEMLTLVRRLVEMHEGSVQAQSDGPGKGSEFVVRLPVAAETAIQIPALPAQDDLHGPKRRVLIADDNRDCADSLAMLLRVMGHEVRTAYDGVQAVEAADELRPDVGLLDIGMPRLNGYDACRRIREQPWGNEMFLIAVTGWGQEEDRQRTEEAGFNRHLVKPIDPSVLMKLLGSLQSTRSPSP